MKGLKSLKAANIFKNILFSVCFLLLAGLLLWQFLLLMDQVRPGEEDFFETKEIKITNHSILQPGSVYYNNGGDLYARYLSGQISYHFFDYLGEEMLQLALMSDDGRTISESEMPVSSACFCFCYEFSLPKKLLTELGASDNLADAYCKAGCNEVWFYPAAYYWQDSIVVLVNREQGYFRKLVIYGKDRNAGDQTNLDYFTSFADNAENDLLYSLSEQGLFFRNTGDLSHLQTCKALSTLMTASGILSETAAEITAQSFFTNADTRMKWNKTEETVVYTNEFATLRLQKDGHFSYFSPGVGGRSVSMAESYDTAYQMLNRILVLSTGGSLEVRLVNCIDRGNNYQYEFAYFYKGIRLGDAETFLMDIRNNEVLRFTGTLLCVTVAETEQVFIPLDEMIREYFELTSESLSRIEWRQYEGIWYPSLCTSDVTVFPFELPKAVEESEEEVSQDEMAQY